MYKRPADSRRQADVWSGGIRPIGKRGLDDICTPGAAISCCLTQHGEMLRVVMLWATDRQTPSPSRVKHIMTKCRRRLRKDANKERPSVRQINRKTSANNIKLKM